MAKAGRGADQYMLRFPEGLRDRIKAVAERKGTSINSEIVRVLERAFPEQWPLEDRLERLADLADILKAGRLDPRIGKFVSDLEETVTGIITGRVTGVAVKTRDRIDEAYASYREREAEEAHDSLQDSTMDLSEDELVSLHLTGEAEQYALPRSRGKRFSEMTEKEQQAYLKRPRRPTRQGHDAHPSSGHDPFAEDKK